MKLMVFIMFFLLLAGFMIISNENLNIAKEGNFSLFVEKYFVWLGTFASNSFTIAGNIVGNAVKVDWMPK